MTSHERSKVSASSRWLIGGGILFSLLPPGLGLLMVADNPIGFRDAETMVDLAAMVFSALALPWIIIAVLLQRSELGLQRKELRLQRFEVTKLAAETERQAKLMGAQLLLSAKADVAVELRSILTAESGKIKALCDSIIDKINEIADSLHPTRSVIGHKRFYGVRAARVRLIFEPLEGQEDDAQVEVRFTELAQHFADDPRIWRLHLLWKRCVGAGLGKWFRCDLPHFVSPLEELNVYQITALVGTAARAR